MSIPLTINGLTFNFPTSQQDPDWSANVSDWAKEVTDAINSVVGTGDLPVTEFNLDNSNTMVDVTGLNFDTALIQAATVYYTISRSTNSVSVYEEGILHLLYTPSDGTWKCYREFTEDAQVLFQITGTGQAQIQCATLAGSSYAGKLTFRAQALTN